MFYVWSLLLLHIFKEQIFTTASTVIFNETYSSLVLGSKFVFDYSYDQHPLAGTHIPVNPNYFNLTQAPDNSGIAMQLNIYNSDISFALGSPSRL